jgi:hypothetical protein
VPEVPVILAHDIFKNCSIESSAEDSDHPARYAVDGMPFSWWKGTSTANHHLTAVMANMVDNPGWEINVDGWGLVESGSGAGTYTRNTTTPIQGDGDGKLVVTTANDSSNIVMLTSYKIYRLKADRTYRLSFAAKSADASKNLRFGFCSPAFAENSDYYDFLACGTTIQDDHIDYTPSADGDYRIYFRALTTTTFYIDCVHLAEMPDMDTVIFFKGHTLQNYKYRITKWNSIYDDETALTWINWTNIFTRDAVYDPNGNTSAGYKTGPRWRIEVQPVYSGADVAYPSIPMMMLGKKWTLPRNFSGNFDPFGVTNKTKVNIGDKGVESIVKQYSQGVFDGTLGNINPTDYTDIEKFMDYTDDGMRYFGFVWRPTTDDHDVRLMRLAKSSRNVPYRGGYIREWPFNAVELTGNRKV